MIHALRANDLRIKIDQLTEGLNKITNSISRGYKQETIRAESSLELHPGKGRHIFTAEKKDVKYRGKLNKDMEIFTVDIHFQKPQPSKMNLEPSSTTANKWHFAHLRSNGFQPTICSCLLLW